MARRVRERRGGDRTFRGDERRPPTVATRGRPSSARFGPAAAGREREGVSGDRWCVRWPAARFLPM